MTYKKDFNNFINTDKGNPVCLKRLVEGGFNKGDCINHLVMRLQKLEVINKNYLSGKVINILQEEQMKVTNNIKTF